MQEVLPALHPKSLETSRAGATRAAAGKSLLVPSLLDRLSLLFRTGWLASLAVKIGRCLKELKTVRETLEVRDSHNATTIKFSLRHGQTTWGNGDQHQFPVSRAITKSQENYQLGFRTGIGGLDFFITLLNHVYNNWQSR